MRSPNLTPQQKESIIQFLTLNPDLTYIEIAQQLGMNHSTLAKFARKRGITRNGVPEDIKQQILQQLQQDVDSYPAIAEKFNVTMCQVRKIAQDSGIIRLSGAKPKKLLHHQKFEENFAAKTIIKEGN